MQLKHYCKGRFRTIRKQRRLFHHRTWLVMKLTIIILLAACLQVSAKGFSQTITLTGKNVPLEKIFKEVKRQSGYLFVYRDEWLKQAKNVDVSISNGTVEQLLDYCFKGQPLTYSIVDKTVVVRLKEEEKKADSTPVIKLTGKVTDKSTGKPLEGTSVYVKNSQIGTSTNSEGLFMLPVNRTAFVLVVAYTGYQTLEMPFDGRTELNIELEPSTSELDNVVMIGYGQTTKRLNTGNVSTVTSEDISKQPVTNALQALEGMVPGLLVTQNSGLPGDGVIVQIRGRNSIAAGNNPLYIVDGVPFTSNQVEVLGYGSPLNSIAPSDIESIDILKDADATAIYGSRAANGVILITTKKGKAGKAKLNISIAHGISSASREATLLNTQQYLAVRKDAMANSNEPVDPAGSPDLATWSQKDDFNWQKWAHGNQAQHNDATLSYGGGNEQTTFLISGAYHNETTVESKLNKFNRADAHVNIDHQSIDKRFRLQLNTFFDASNNNRHTVVPPLFQVLTSVPNYPNFNPDGSYNWYSINNLAQATAFLKSNTTNLNSNLNLSYMILSGLNIKANLGYNRIENDQVAAFPSTYNNPLYNIGGRSVFTNQYIQTVLLEPQIQYDQNIFNGNLQLLIGTTVQRNITTSRNMDVSGYSNDLLLENPGYGSSTYPYGSNLEYKYISAFGRLTYNWKNQYLINGSVRRDGSSRFGPDKKFGNFGSIGSAWIFSATSFVKNKLPVLSFGKIRGSYGTTGNDAIGDYQYLSTYVNTNYYGNQQAIVPSRIASNDYSWEVNKKLEFSLDLGFFNDRILMSSSWYQNRSGNQLVGYSLPAVTGFNSYIANLAAVVQNTGWEFQLNTTNIKTSSFQWKTSFNLTLPKNKLLQYDGLEASTYANKLVIGRSLNIVQGYHFVNVDAQSGLAVVEDVNHDGNITPVSSYNNQGGDYIIMGQTTPDWYGGMMNTFTYKGFQLDVMLQFAKQKGYNVYSYNYANFGWLSNVWTDYLGYWKQPGDKVNLPKPTYDYEPSAYNFQTSDAGFTDASYLRFKTISLSYNFSATTLKKTIISSLKLFVQAQNYFTITKYKGYDPELAGNRGLSMPILKTINFGLQCSF